MSWLLHPFGKGWLPLKGLSRFNTITVQDEQKTLLVKRFVPLMACRHGTQSASVVVVAIKRGCSWPQLSRTEVQNSWHRSLPARVDLAGDFVFPQNCGRGGWIG